MFGLIWFCGEDLNVIFYRILANFRNPHKSTERKISQKNEEYMEVRADRHKFERDHPMTIPARFRLREEDLNVKLMMFDGRTDGLQVMVEAHMAYD
jgi:hypothetical protein